MQINVSQNDTHLIQLADECRYNDRLLKLIFLKIESISSCNGSKFTINHDIEMYVSIVMGVKITKAAIRLPKSYCFLR